LVSTPSARTRTAGIATMMARCDRLRTRNLHSVSLFPLRKALTRITREPSLLRGDRGGNGGRNGRDGSPCRVVTARGAVLIVRSGTARVCPCGSRSRCAQGLARDSNQSILTRRLLDLGFDPERPHSNGGNSDDDGAMRQASEDWTSQADLETERMPGPASSMIGGGGTSWSELCGEGRERPSAGCASEACRPVCLARSGLLSGRAVQGRPVQPYGRVFVHDRYRASPATTAAAAAGRRCRGRGPRLLARRAGSRCTQPRRPCKRVFPELLVPIANRFERGRLDEPSRSRN
jgi:hypothetical protein